MKVFALRLENKLLLVLKFLTIMLLIIMLSYCWLNLLPLIEAKFPLDSTFLLLGPLPWHFSMIFWSGVDLLSSSIQPMVISHQADTKRQTTDHTRGQLRVSINLTASFYGVWEESGTPGGNSGGCRASMSMIQDL